MATEDETGNAVQMSLLSICASFAKYFSSGNADPQKDMLLFTNCIPVLSAMQRSLGIGMERTKTVFITVFLFAHGYASMIANNELKYDEDTINSHLERAYRGAILAAQEEMA